MVMVPFNVTFVQCCIFSLKYLQLLEALGEEINF